jgi:hypothetical protein
MIGMNIKALKEDPRLEVVWFYGSEYFAIIVNGQTFSHDLDSMRAFIAGDGKLDGETKIGLSKKNSIPLSKDYGDHLLGTRTVWALKEGVVQEIEVSVFTFDTYSEAQKDPDFLKKCPTFVGVFTEKELRRYNYRERMPHDGEHVIEHVPSHMQCGTRYVWLSLLEKNELCKKVYVKMPTWLKRHHGCFSCYVKDPELFAEMGFKQIGLYGNTIGIAPENIDRLVTCTLIEEHKTRKTSPELPSRINLLL